ncbi:exoribonuclease family protein [Xylariaceae sp. FL0016]|nr:exoribonuclease family protein [Xylariaceae sp. FL0016]
MATASSDSLTLSSSTFAKLSPHPYLLANLQPPDPSTTPSSRTNGRQPRQARPPQINTGSLSHAHGSAVVRTGDTTVICGVRGETLLASNIPNYRVPTSSDHEDADADDDAREGGGGGGRGGRRRRSSEELREYDLIVPNVELATGCAPNFLPGVPPTALAQTLSTRAYSLLHSARLLDAEDLRIYYDPSSEAAPATGEEEAEEEEGEEDVYGALKKEVKAYWVLYIDVLFISFDGNPFDAAWAAIVAALRDTKLPSAYWDPDNEMVLCRRGKPNPLHISGLPVACTSAVFTAKEKQRERKGKGSDFWILVDPDRFEEGLCDESLTMVVDCEEGGETKLLGLSKGGGMVVGPMIVRKYLEVAESRWKEFKAAMP